MYVQDSNTKVYDRRALVLHAPANLATGETVNIRALQIGITNLAGKTLILLDCGTLTNATRLPKETP
jgi:hypothetical protein